MRDARGSFLARGPGAIATWRERVVARETWRVRQESRVASVEEFVGTRRARVWGLVRENSREPLPSFSRGGAAGGEGILARGMNLEGGGNSSSRSSSSSGIGSASEGGGGGMNSVSCGNGKLRQWLIEQIDSGKYPGLVWENDEKSIFRIPWKHAGKQDYNRDEDAALFKVPARKRSLAGQVGRLA